MTSIDFKVIGLTRHGVKPAGSGFEPARFRFPDLPAWEADTLLIQPLSSMWLYVVVSIKRLTIPGRQVSQATLTSQVQETHRHVGIGTVVTSGSLGGGMVSTLAWNISTTYQQMQNCGTPKHYIEKPSGPNAN